MTNPEKTADKQAGMRDEDRFTSKTFEATYMTAAVFSLLSPHSGHKSALVPVRGAKNPEWNKQERIVSSTVPLSVQQCR